MPTRALLVDVDGTLYHQTQVRLGMMLRMARAYALQPRQGRDVVRALSAYRQAQETLRHAAFDSTIPLDQRQLREAAKNHSLNLEAFMETTGRWMLTEPLRLLKRARRPGVAETFAALKARGWKLAAVSDYPAVRKMEALGLTVDAVICAQDSGVQRFKPSPAGIEAALQLLNVRPENAIYIGDRSDVDGAAARAAHVRPLILKPRARFPSADEIEATLGSGCSPDG